MSIGARPSAPDADARAAALDPARSFIVEAPAGSGKTTLLIQRFLALLARVERPEALLAITFTRKAAAEMRDKVVSALVRAAAGEGPEHAADAETLALARRVLALDADRGWELIRQPGRLRIQTIDALNHWLAARLPVLSRAGAPLRIAERPGALYYRAARRTVAELEQGEAFAGQLAHVLEHLDNDVDKLEPLLAQMLARRDQWLRHIRPDAAAGFEPALRRELEEALDALVREALERVAALLPAPELCLLWPLARAAAARHPQQTEGIVALAAIAPAAGLPASTTALAAWQALAGLLVTKGLKARFRSRLTRAEGFPPEAAADRQQWQALIDRLRAVRGLEAAVAAVPLLPAPRYDDRQWQVLLALRAVLLRAAGELGVLFAGDGEVDHSAVQAAALAALGTPEEPSELTLALDYRTEHILVDEFQDTSAAQVALLAQLTAGWQTGDGRTLFLVGDPMQSIYAFRGTDVGLFLRSKREGLGGIALTTLRLSANFRSRPAIVDWFNASFPLVLAPEEELARGAVPYSPAVAVQAPGPPAPVAVELLLGADPAAEGRETAALIALERARHPKSSVAVLARTRAALGHVARALDAAHVPFTGVDLVPLAERAAVRDLMALTRAILHPADRVAWLGCLRAPWCGLSLATLHTLAGDSDAPLPGLIGEQARLERLDPEQRARLAATRAVLEAARGERGRRPLAATIEAAWLALGGPATLEDAADLRNADAFLAELGTLEHAADLEDPVALAEALEELYAAPAANADPLLELMTVHAAKGLEWDTVFVVGLGRAGRTGEAALLNWLEYARAGAGLGLVLAPHRAGASESDALEAWLRTLARGRDELELARLAYVAATRAKERLVLVGHLEAGKAPGTGRAPRQGTLLARLWPAIGSFPPRLGAMGGASASRAPPLARLAPGWRVPAAAAALIALADPPPRAGPAEFEFEWVGAAARHVGTVVHEALEAMARPADPIADRAREERRWRRRLVELGVPDAELERALGRVVRALDATRADPRGRWLFAPGHREVASELALSGARAGDILSARIDRTFVDADGVRWIVDFKTSVHEGTDLDAFLDQERERYRPQLEAYAALMRAIDPLRPIRLGLYFPLLGGWRDWPASV